MRTLHKYILKQVAAAAGMTVGLFVFVLVLGNVIKEVMGDVASGKIDFGFFVYIICLIIPGVIPYALPLGMLTGILLVFGRMSAQSEITAMKAGGVSLFSMACPVFLISILASIFSVGINFYYAPVADYTYKSALKNLVRNNPLRFIQPGVFIKDFPGYIIYANDADKNGLTGLRIWEIDTNGDIKSALSAKRGSIWYDDANEEIMIRPEYSITEQRRSVLDDDFSKPLTVFESKEFLIKLPLNKIFQSFSGQKKKLSLMTFGELMNARKTWHSVPEKELTKEIIFRDKIKVQTQIQKNFAMAFSIFSMVVLAIPLGIKASRSETLANVGIALALAMTYYMSTVFITWLEAVPEFRPDILIWLPNIIFQILGICLMFRANRT